MNTALCLVFSNAEVNAVALLANSEHRFADIYGKASGAPYEGRILCLVSREFMPDGKDLWIFSFASCILKLCIRMTKFIKLSMFSSVLWPENFE